MERSQRLHQLWSWLPAFRAVAETEHLPSAAARLGVSPPALSRSIALLEDRLGARLFDRERRRLVLNDAGRELLGALRDAMRLLDDGWDRALDAESRGPVRIAVASDAAGGLLAPVLDELARTSPGVVPQVRHCVSDDSVPLLLAGEVDVALVEQRIARSELRVDLVRRLRMHVYCGARSPLWRKRQPTRAQILEQPFVVPSVDGGDGWPVHVPRTIGVVSGSMSLALDLCARGTWLAALPESIEAMHSGAELRRLPEPAPLQPVHLYVVTRRPAGRHARSPAKIEAVRTALLGIVGA